MEISQRLAAGAIPAASKASGTTNGNGFSQLLKQAGDTTASAKELLNPAAPGHRDKAPAALLTAGESIVPGTSEMLDSATASAEQLAGLSSAELTALPQSIAPVLGSTQPLGDDEMVDLNSAELASLSQQIASVQGSTQPLGDDGMLDLTAIRQRLDLVASAQRGDAAVVPQLAIPLGSQLAQASQAALPGGQGETGSLRHQHLTAQGMQALAHQQQDASLLNAGQQPGSFSDAIAAVTGKDMSMPARDIHSSEPNSLPTLAGHTAGTTTSAGQAQGVSSSAPVLGTPLASAQWQQGLGQHLVALHQRGGQKVDLHLHPAELGPLTISLKVDDQLAQAQFFSANPQVRAAIEQAIPHLREALEESGIQLGEAMVGDHQQRDDGASDSQKGAATNPGHGIAAETDPLADNPAVMQPALRSIAMDGRVDLYA